MMFETLASFLQCSLVTTLIYRKIKVNPKPQVKLTQSSTMTGGYPSKLQSSTRVFWYFIFLDSVIQNQIMNIQMVELNSNPNGWVDRYLTLSKADFSERVFN